MATYAIPEANVDELTKRLARLAARAQHCGCDPITWRTVGEDFRPQPPAVEPLIVGQGSRGPFVAAFQSRVGPGFLLSTGLRLTTSFPEAESLLDEMVRYLLSDRLATTGHLDLDTLRRWTARARRRKALLNDLNGLDYVVNANEAIENYPGFQGPRTVFVARQTDGQSEVIWKTQVPREETNGRRRFAWAGGMGWVTQPAGGVFRLLLNGTPLLEFDIAPKLTADR